MTSQQRADALLREYQVNRGRNMDLADWDVKIKPHLQFISAGAEMTARHARALPCKPDFKTIAQEDLAEARRVLEAALGNIIAAQAIYANRPKENEHAA